MPLPRLQADFFARIADPQGVRAIFEHMPGVFFFMKDDQGRHIAANSATFERFGIKSERELVGEMDEKFFPPEVARAYREDDQKVILSGKPLINRIDRQRFEPGEVEDVVIAAADELDAAVAGLDGGEVAVVLGAGVAEREHVAVDAVHGALFAAGGDEALVRPGFAVVEGDRRRRGLRR
jgi:PAS domain-containing protein